MVVDEVSEVADDLTASGALPASLAFQLKDDLKEIATQLSPAEARLLVDAFYRVQQMRVRAGNQVFALREDNRPHAAPLWVYNCSSVMEKQIHRALDAYSAAQPLGQWARRQVGIGPVLSAALLAYIDVSYANTVGQIWRFAGLDPTCVWEAGQKRPWNAKLKTLCWKISESFVKVSGRDNAFYGKLYAARKAFETERNEAGANAEAAAKELQKHPKHKQAAIYKTGKLPPGQVHARAERWIVKLFLSHYHEVGRKLLGLPVPAPFAQARLGHANYIPPPE